MFQEKREPLKQFSVSMDISCGYFKALCKQFFGKPYLSALRPVSEYLTELVDIHNCRSRADGVLAVEVFNKSYLCSGTYFLHDL